MIVWWGWVLLWLGLALILVAVLALSAWLLFRKALGLADDLADLTDQLDALSAAEGQPRLGAPELAVLAESRDIRAREQERIAGRRDRRDRRQERRMSRAFEIGAVDVTETRWPDAWYRRRSAKSHKD